MSRYYFYRCEYGCCGEYHPKKGKKKERRAEKRKEKRDWKTLAKNYI